MRPAQCSHASRRIARASLISPMPSVLPSSPSHCPSLPHCLPMAPWRGVALVGGPSGGLPLFLRERLFENPPPLTRGSSMRQPGLTRGSRADHRGRSRYGSGPRHEPSLGLTRAAPGTDDSDPGTARIVPTWVRHIVTSVSGLRWPPSAQHCGGPPAIDDGGGGQNCLRARATNLPRAL